MPASTRHRQAGETGYGPTVPAAAPIPPPPEDRGELLAWAQAHDVVSRLDDVLVAGDGAPGTFLPAHGDERLSYRQILVDAPPGPALRRAYADLEETARAYLHRIAELTAQQRAVRAFMDEHGRDPEEAVLAAFLARLRSAHATLRATGEAVPRRIGTFEPVRVRPQRDPAPMLRYEERPLVAWRGDAQADVTLSLLGWEHGAFRWALYRGERLVAGDVSPDRQLAALDAIIDLVRDPHAVDARELLSELLRLPAWQYALGTLDEDLARLSGPGAEAGARSERLTYRVLVLTGGTLTIEPVVQKRSERGGYSKGARIEWFHLPERHDLSAADKRAFAAYDDRFARRSAAWGGGLTAAQVFGILQALVDHPAVFLGGDRDEAGRLDIRQGRLRLRFVRDDDDALCPQFELVGLPLLPSEVAGALGDDRYLIHLHRPRTSAPQVLLAQVGPAASALVRALAVAPVRFPPGSHDALAARLEALQDTLEIEFPSQWTRTITPADGRIVVLLDLLASGALAVQLGVRPIRHGPVFAPGEGPTLLLEGDGRDRHGVRREREAERAAARALAQRLGLGDSPPDPWRWRVPGGDPAFELVAALRALTHPPMRTGSAPPLAEEAVIEWADEERLLDLGSIGRPHLRLKVGDDRDWFTVEGGAEVEGEVVPLATLLSAIRENRRYVTVGRHGFVRLEESLRRALAEAQAAFLLERGVLHIAPVRTDPLLALIEDQAQIEACAAFSDLRRRMTAGAELAPRLPSALAAALRPYQMAGVSWLVRLAHWGAGAVLADEMGLGKTVQTLAVLTHRAPQGPALVVAPTSVVPNWAAEAARFAPELKVIVYRGPDRQAALHGLGPGDLVLTSYAIATLDSDALEKVSFASLVLDEAQAIKNATTERAKSLRALKAEWRLGLTGTPIENALGELWSLFRVISPGLFGPWEHFRGTYAIPIEKFGDASRRKSLAATLRPFVLRRTKAEVAPELPRRTELVRAVRLSREELALYDQLRASLLEEIAQAKQDPDRDVGDLLRFNLLAAITRLRQLCCHPRLVYPRAAAGSSKMSYLVDLLGELRQGGHRALVFSQFRSFLDLLSPRLRQAGFRVLGLDGTTPAEVRAERVATFQAGSADAFLISLKAGGFGLNLTAADTVIHLDPWWNPAVEDQATARAHRIGQTRPVTAIRLVAGGTIEEAVLGLHAAKRALAAGVLEGSELAAGLSTSELLALIKRAPEAGEAEE